MLISLAAMLLAPGGEPPDSFANPRHEGRSLVIGEDPGAASQGPAPYLNPNWPRDLVGSLVECSQALCLKRFEVKSPSAIDVVKSVSF